MMNSMYKNTENPHSAPVKLGETWAAWKEMENSVKKNRGLVWKKRTGNEGGGSNPLLLALLLIRNCCRIKRDFFRWILCGGLPSFLLALS